MLFWIKNLAFTLLMIIPSMAFYAQGTSKVETLKKIKTIKDAETLLKTIAPNAGAIGRFNSIADSVEYKEISKNYGIGDIFYGKKLTYKILKKEKETINRCQYIYLDGNVYNHAQIDSIRNEIIAKFNAGTSFKTLSDKYGMDGNKNGGELGWFHSEKMGEEFMTTYEGRSKGEIFACNVTSKKAYYVILKTHGSMIADSWVYITLR